MAEEYLLSELEFVVDDGRITDWDEVHEIAMQQQYKSGLKDARDAKYRGETSSHTKIMEESRVKMERRRKWYGSSNNMNSEDEDDQFSGVEEKQDHHQQQQQQTITFAFSKSLSGGRKMERQYIHRTGCAFVRVADGQGFVWVTNRLKVNDLNMSSSQRFYLSESLLHSFRI